MRIRAGYSLGFSCPQPTPMVLMLSVHPSRLDDLVSPHVIRFDPPVQSHDYRDSFGNTCTRIVAPAGPLTIATDFEILDSGLPDRVAPDAEQHAVQDLPDATLLYLMGSRYCDTDLLSNTAWQMFEHVPAGWQRVQAIIEHVHHRLQFGYEFARPTRTAWDGFHEQLGVCRDFAHLAITFCRCMNIPARYCTGYLGDIGVPKDPAPMDFSAWLEVFLDGQWFAMDARHNKPRIGRILMATGRDAADVALTTTFGPHTLTRFEVHTDEVPEDAPGVAPVATDAA